jgi:hypothetical protein
VDLDLFANLTQFGTAGLIGWMWLVERRAASERERQAAELHERLMQDRRGLEIAVEALRENTRVLGAVEAAQRSLLAVVERLHPRETRAA